MTFSPADARNATILYDNQNLHDLLQSDRVPELEIEPNQLDKLPLKMWCAPRNWIRLKFRTAYNDWHT
jgi:hypothetical protein